MLGYNHNLYRQQNASALSLKNGNQSENKSLFKQTALPKTMGGFSGKDFISQFKMQLNDHHQNNGVGGGYGTGLGL